jgi:hypothetical protein
MTDDESINELAEQRREEAFIAAPWHWRDIPLHPLSIGREGDWLQHCRRIGLPPLHEVINSGEGFLSMAQRLLWFCAHEPRAWLSVWMKGGEAAPIVLESRITEWADKNILPGDQLAVLKLALDIYDRSRATQAHRVEDEADDVGEGSGLAQEHKPLSSSARPSPAQVTSKPSITRHRRNFGQRSIATDARKAQSTNGRKTLRKKRRPSEAT